MEKGFVDRIQTPSAKAHQATYKRAADLDALGEGQGVRHQPGSRPRRARRTATAVRRRLSAGSPAGRERRLLRRSAAERLGHASRQRREDQEPVRRARSGHVGADRRFEGPRHARRDAGGLDGRLRPDADHRQAGRPRSLSARLDAPSWPAAASRPARRSAAPTSWAARSQTGRSAPSISWPPSARRSASTPARSSTRRPAGRCAGVVDEKEKIVKELFNCNRSRLHRFRARRRCANDESIAEQLRSTCQSARTAPPPFPSDRTAPPPVPPAPPPRNRSPRHRRPAGSAPAQFRFPAHRREERRRRLSPADLGANDQVRHRPQRRQAATTPRKR